MIKKISKFEIIIFLLSTFLFSCNYTRNKEFVIDENYYLPITYEDIEILIDMAISFSLVDFPDDINYSIYPNFYDDIEDKDILKNISQMSGNYYDGRDTSFFYCENELNQFIADNNFLKGKSIKPFSSVYYEKFIIEDYNSDVTILLCPPWVDRRNSIVCILSNTLHKVEYLRGDYMLSHHFFVFKFTINDGWILFNVLPFKQSKVEEALEFIRNNDVF